MRTSVSPKCWTTACSCLYNPPSRTPQLSYPFPSLTRPGSLPPLPPGAAAEKQTRGLLRSAVQGAVSRDTVVILDSGNFIKARIED